MRQSQYTLQFCAPAFLGNAEQSGQWRTPPFKAQLRQWWRVAYAASNQFHVNVEAMRREEGRLFGNAWLADNFSKSDVRIRLANWNPGKLHEWERHDNSVPHPNVSKPVGSQLYLGFGPLVFRAGTALKANAAIQAGDSNTFSIAFPECDAQLLEHALTLMNQFGTVGGRSRNGWGSYSLHPGSGTSALPAFTPIRPWSDALSLDWAHAIGADTKGPLIWQTRPFANWQTLMRELAIIKISLRTYFSFRSGKNAQHPEERHWLSYPVTHHSVQSWGNNARLPNSLRFKIRPAPDGQLVGVIFHMPCLPPASFQPDPLVIAGVWQKVHAFLDSPDRHLTRIPA
ncbi:RAMP superfamily CRISPR-associated protein [uncultured Zoogloea sp.]|uniref:RAMP superfamily CRISPR-associated protein n=1 Tax=uncultured Zoogloea sp. TaxID=160237 RepID=UPI002624BD30|nr:RAMP superfamily CRISPR-associated protein [uncultured Zoogloea sp.]